MTCLGAHRKSHESCVVAVPQFMPLLALSPRCFDSLYSTYHRAVMRFDVAARRLVPWQHLTFLPLLCVAKFGESRAHHLQEDRTPDIFSLEQAAAGPTLPRRSRT